MKSGISWVSWVEVFRCKEEGGLGIRCLETFNEALLCKWRWRFLEDKETLWRPLLDYRYGQLNVSRLNGCSTTVIRKSSFW